MAARPFLETLRDIRRGACLDELAIKLNELVGQIRATGKGGQMILKLTLKPAGKHDANVLSITDEIILKLPELDGEVTIFFPTADNNLSRQDPGQFPLELRAVGEPTIDPETGEILTGSRA